MKSFEINRECPLQIADFARRDIDAKVFPEITLDFFALAVFKKTLRPAKHHNVVPHAAAREEELFDFLCAFDKQVFVLLRAPHFARRAKEGRLVYDEVAVGQCPSISSSSLLHVQGAVAMRANFLRHCVREN